MTGNLAKIRTTGKKSPVGMRRENARMLDFQRISVFWGLFGRCIGHVNDEAT
jgi:hypothetical protein